MIRWACVTGADRGVGLELTRGLLQQGVEVCAGQYLKDDKQLQELKQHYGERLHIISLDVSDSDSVRAAVQDIARLTDQLDLLINNAAILGDIESTIEDQLDVDRMMDVLQTNTLGALRVSNGLIDMIMNSHCKLIVNISSEAGSIEDCSRTSWYAYCMSKAALNMQSHLIHNQMTRSGGKVLVIHPGWVQTYMQGKLDTRAELTPRQAASRILRVISMESDPDQRSTDFAFIDSSGNSLPW